MPLPSSASVHKCIETVTNNDSADYFAKALADKLKKEKVADQYSDLLDDARKFADFIGQQSSGDNPWTGSFSERSSFQRYQTNLAETSAKMLTDKTIIFDFAVGDHAEILRGYSSNGAELSNEESGALDKLFNAWLAEKNMITKDGIIYEATDDGKIKQDAKGQDKRADADRLRQLITDKKEGFNQYIQSKNSAISINAVRHDHPEKAAEKKKEAATQEQQRPG